MAADGVLVILLALICVSWADSALKNLDDQNFEHLTQAATGATTGDWLVVFSMEHEKCVKCKEVEEAFEKVHEKLGHKLNVAKVWPTGSLFTHRRFGVAKWPSVYFFRHGRMYTYPNEQYEGESFVKFVEEGYTFAANVAVPPPTSAFDIYMEHLSSDVKHVINLRKNAAAVIFIAGILLGLVLTSMLKCVSSYLMNTFLQEPEELEKLEEVEEGEEGEVEKESEEIEGEQGVESEDRKGDEAEEGKEGSVGEVGRQESDGHNLEKQGEEDKKTK